jgi:hypothetical protein
LVVKKKREKILKNKDAAIMLKAFSNSKHFIKLDELIKLYMDCHDLMTKVGSEIADEKIRVVSSMVEQWTFNPFVLGSNPRRPIL